MYTKPSVRAVPFEFCTETVIACKPTTVVAALAGRAALVLAHPLSTCLQSAGDAMVTPLVSLLT